MFLNIVLNFVVRVGHVYMYYRCLGHSYLSLQYLELLILVILKSCQDLSLSWLALFCGQLLDHLASTLVMLSIQPGIFHPGSLLQLLAGEVMFSREWCFTINNNCFLPGACLLIMEALNTLNNIGRVFFNKIYLILLKISYYYPEWMNFESVDVHNC